MKVRIDGRGMERFFNIAAQREIEIWDIETEEREKKCGGKRSVYFKIMPRDFKHLKSIAEKTEDHRETRTSLLDDHRTPPEPLGRRTCCFFSADLRLIFLCVGHLL